MSKIDVSIIIPVYNVENYLEESLNSVANQTFTNYELIIINDGSTDQSEEIILKFIDQHSDMAVKYISQQNKGQSFARNVGINEATGEYLYFFDRDDLLADNAMELLYEQAKTYHLDLLLFSGEAFFETEDANATKYQFDYFKKEQYPETLNGPKLFVELIKNKDYSTSPCLYLVKKSLLVNKKITFYEGIIHEDALFTFQLLLSAERAKVMNDVLFYRRVRLNSTMTAINYTKRFNGIYTVLIEMIRFQKKLENTSPELEKAINNRIADAFGNSVNQYIYMENNEQKNHKNQFQRLKEIGKEYDYFKRKDYWLFGQQEKVYSLLRKTFDSINQRKGK